MGHPAPMHGTLTGLGIMGAGIPRSKSEAVPAFCHPRARAGRMTPCLRSTPFRTTATSRSPTAKPSSPPRCGPIFRTPMRVEVKLVVRHVGYSYSKASRCAVPVRSARRGSPSSYASVRTCVWRAKRPCTGTYRSDGQSWIGSILRWPIFWIGARPPNRWGKKCVWRSCSRTSATTLHSRNACCRTM